MSDAALPLAGERIYVDVRVVDRAGNNEVLEETIRRLGGRIERRLAGASIVVYHQGGSHVINHWLDAGAGAPALVRPTWIRACEEAGKAVPYSGTKFAVEPFVELTRLASLPKQQAANPWSDPVAGGAAGSPAAAGNGSSGHADSPQETVASGSKASGLPPTAGRRRKAPKRKKLAQPTEPRFASSQRSDSGVPASPVVLPGGVKALTASSPLAAARRRSSTPQRAEPPATPPPAGGAGATNSPPVQAAKPGASKRKRGNATLGRAKAVGLASRAAKSSPGKRSSAGGKVQAASPSRPPRSATAPWRCSECSMENARSSRTCTCCNKGTRAAGLAVLADGVGAEHAEGEGAEEPGVALPPSPASEVFGGEYDDVHDVKHAASRASGSTTRRGATPKASASKKSRAESDSEADEATPGAGAKRSNAPAKRRRTDDSGEASKSGGTDKLNGQPAASPLEKGPEKPSRTAASAPSAKRTSKLSKKRQPARKPAVERGGAGGSRTGRRTVAEKAIKPAETETMDDEAAPPGEPAGARNASRRSQKAYRASRDESEAHETWGCSACTLENSKSARRCAVCKAPRPSEQTKASSAVASAPAAGRPRPSIPTIGVSCLKEWQGDAVAHTVKVVGARKARLARSTDDSANVTHLILGDSKRTLKVLFARARGAWILKPSWILSALETGVFPPEEEHLFDLTTLIEKAGGDATASFDSTAPARALSGFSVFVERAARSQCRCLPSLVEVAGGKVVTKRSEASLCIQQTPADASDEVPSIVPTTLFASVLLGREVSV